MESQPSRPFPRVVAKVGPEPHATKQSFKDETDINNIMARYKKTGAIDHFNRYSPMYGEILPIDYQTALNTIKTAQQMFADLPSHIRAEVQTPEGFLEFVQDPKNKERMKALGLLAQSGPPALDDSKPTDANPPAGG